MPKVRTREWSGSVSGESPFTSGTTAAVVSTMLVELPHQLVSQHEAAMQAVAKELVTVKVVEAEADSPEDEVVAIVAEVEAWVPAAAVSQTKVMLLVMPSPPIPSQKRKPSLPKTHLRKNHVVLRKCTSEQLRLQRDGTDCLNTQHMAHRISLRIIDTNHLYQAFRRPKGGLCTFRSRHCPMLAPCTSAAFFDGVVFYLQLDFLCQKAQGVQLEGYPGYV